MSRKKKNLSIEEKIEIINNDPVLWIGNFVKVPNENSELVPFKMNAAQKDFLKNKGRFSCVCKCRQLGISTGILGYFLFKSHMMPNSNYLIVADKDSSTQNLFSRLKIMYESIPDGIRVGQRRSNKYELFLQNNSRITVQTSGHKEIGRSFTLQGILCSEFALWTNEQQEKAIVSLEQALAKNKDAFMVLESTANGVGNKFHEVFTSAEKGQSNYKAFFYGWASKTHRQMHEFEIEEATEWFKSQNHGQMINANALDMYPEELEIYNNFDVTIKQILWRRYKMSSIGEEKFDQEQPLTSSHAFIQSDSGFFDAFTITERYKHLMQTLSTKEIGKDLPSSLLKYYGKGLYIYQPVKRNETYHAGIDVASGTAKKNGDYSAISILDSSGEQVAVFYKNDIPIYRFAKICYDLGMFYNYCMFVIERNSYGLSLIDKLRREMNYIQVLRFNKFDKIKGVLTSEFGYYTDNVSKTKLMQDMKEAFETGVILINDRETLDQMKIYVEKNGRMGNIRGTGRHDDLVDATALAIQSLKQSVSYI